jgi:hypothetical protein
MRRTIYGSFAELKRLDSECAVKARSILDAALTIDIRNHRASEPLTEAIQAWIEVRELGDSAGASRRRSVLTACRRTLERLFSEMAKRWPLTGMAQHLSRDQIDLNRARLQSAAYTVGLAELPEPLAKVLQWQVRLVERGDGWRLRALVAATILMAADEPAHPLRAAAIQAPDLLMRIEQIIVHAGEAAHDMEDGQFELTMVENCITATVDSVGLLLGLPRRALNEVALNE